VLNILLKYIKNLIFDRVVNVRLTIANVISDLFKNKSNIKYLNLKKDHSWVLENSEILKIVNFLKKDSNKNVFSLFSEIEIGNYFFTEEEIYDSNPSFTNKMSLIKDEFGIVKNLPSNSKINLKNNPILDKKTHIVSNDKLNNLNTYLHMNKMQLESTVTTGSDSNNTQENVGISND
jgi:hypothetical protein